MESRNRFIDHWLKGTENVLDLCAVHGISRKTGYKWLARYDQEGRKGLEDRSRAPHGRPQSTAERVVELVLAARKERPTWGPRKLKAYLERRHPRAAVPAASTIGGILRSHGLVSARRIEKKTPTYEGSLGEFTQPNAIWGADFKGPVPLARRQRCSPLTISDGFSRFLLRCDGLVRLDYMAVRPVFESVFREFGLPEAIRTDNGPPFASRAPGGLSQLSIWWMKLGIVHERIQPGRPTQNGRHERLHRTLALEACTLPRKSWRLQQSAFDRFRQEYNEVRPHEALGNRCPADFYVRSARRFPRPLVEPEYSPAYDVRVVRASGEVKWRGGRIFLSETLRGERVGLKWCEEFEGWAVEFGTLHLGVVDTSGDFRRPAQPGRTARSKCHPCPRSGL